jgi:hypothetical protein
MILFWKKDSEEGRGIKNRGKGERGKRRRGKLTQKTFPLFPLPLFTPWFYAPPLPPQSLEVI